MHLEISGNWLYNRVNFMEISWKFQFLSNDTNRAAHNSTQRIPGSLVEPVVKVVEAMLDHVVGRTVVEPGGERDRG